LKNTFVLLAALVALTSLAVAGDKKPDKAATYTMKVTVKGMT